MTARAGAPRRTWSRSGSITLAAAIVAALAVLTMAGSALGYFAARGAGTGTGTSGTVATTAITLTPGTASGTLYPGSTGSVSTVAANSSAAQIRIVSLQLDTARGTNGFSVDTAHSGCPTTAFSFTTQNNGGSGWNIPANGSTPISMASAVTMTTTAANACQGVSLTVFLRAVS